MKFIEKPAIPVLAAIAFLFAVSSANAVPTLRLTQGSTTFTVADGSALDANAAAGGVTFIGSVGTFTTNVSTGLTKPIIGSSSTPDIDLNSVDVSSGTGGSLTVAWSDTDFTSLSPVSINAFIGGTSGLSVVPATSLISWSLYGSSANDLFGTGSLLWTSSFTGPGAFSDSLSNIIFNPLGAYSLTLVATITHATAQTSSFDFGAQGTPLPEPTPLALISLGLFILASYRLKIREQQ